MFRSLRLLLQLIAVSFLSSYIAGNSVVLGTSSGRCQYPALIDATVEDLQRGLFLRCFSSVDLVNVYQQRIGEVNNILHPVSEVNPDAITIAAGLDEERRKGKIRGPLHGLPVLIKGNIGSGDKLQTDAGSFALTNAVVAEDATVTRKLREAGIVILGKTSLSEWANFRSSNSTNGWSAVSGQVTGAYYPKQDPSGSSSGSGVAADLALAWATLGTETSGSIVSPSSNNNIVGIKPTVGLTSRYNVVPISSHQDTIGPMARTVKDAAFLLQAIVGKDQHDNYTSAIPFQRVPNYVLACRSSALRGKRIGVPSNVLDQLRRIPNMKPVLDAFHEALVKMEHAGAHIVKDANFTAYEEYIKSEAPSIVVYADFLSDLASYLSGLKSNPNKLRDLADVRRFVQNHPKEEYPNRNTLTWDEALNQGFNNTSPNFWPAYQKNLYFGGEGGILGALKRHRLDAVVVPTDIGYPIAGVVGSPMISVPLGAYPENQPLQYEPRHELVEISPNFPFGIGFMGDLWSEEKLIGMAYAFEQKTKSRYKLKRYIEPKAELKALPINTTPSSLHPAQLLLTA